jgi:hypothetical protein
LCGDLRTFNVPGRLRPGESTPFAQLQQPEPHQPPQLAAGAGQTGV